MKGVYKIDPVILPHLFPNIVRGILLNLEFSYNPKKIQNNSKNPKKQKT